MEISYKTRGTCSRSIHITLSDDGVIESCSFEGGCPGNTQGVAALVRGM
ncbi:MAG TPA: TSCPD domain-containing protein, partial [Candidatus Spyradocola merdavium]|nr:TSCPD domain-containing protein [Candidatus Spyradocola merdavium]